MNAFRSVNASDHQQPPSRSHFEPVSLCHSSDLMQLLRVGGGSVKAQVFNILYSM